MPELMKPNINWINDWQIGVISSKETVIAGDLLDFFLYFWDKMKLNEEKIVTLLIRERGDVP